MAVTFNISEGQELSLRNKKALKEWISAIVKSEKKKPGELNFVFLSDNELLKFNRQYLGHDTYTDIITFDYTEGDRVSGDVLISVERVSENAVKYGSEFNDELHRVMAHGVLHLCGYKDKSEKDKALMRSKEEMALAFLKNR